MKKSYWVIRLGFYAYIIYVYFSLVKADSFFSFLFLNMILAYIPIELTMHMKVKQNPVIFWGLACVWLLFYPNAPYILTDLFHLAKINPYSLQTGLMVLDLNKWWYFTQLVLSALAGALLGQWSLLVVSKTMAARYHLSALSENLITLGLFVCAAVGVFIGRFLRIHTIYLVVEPHRIINQLLTMWSPAMLAYVGIIFLLQLVIWGCYLFTKHDLARFEQN